MSAAGAGRGMRGAMGRLGALSVKELLQLHRDRLTLAMMVALPAVQLLLFGYAIDTDVRHVPAVVLDYDRSAASRDFVARLQATGFYDMRGEVRSYDEIGRALRAGRAKAALVFPARWGADAGAGRRASLQLVIDGSDPQTVGSALDTGDRPRRSRARAICWSSASDAPASPCPPRRSPSSRSPGTTPTSRRRPSSCPAWSA